MGRFGWVVMGGSGCFFGSYGWFGIIVGASDWFWVVVSSFK